MIQKQLVVVVKDVAGNCSEGCFRQPDDSDSDDWCSRHKVRRCRVCGFFWDGFAQCAFCNGGREAESVGGVPLESGYESDDSVVLIQDGGVLSSSFGDA